jgi:ATP-dependent DNA ligase
MAAREKLNGLVVHRSFVAPANHGSARREMFQAVWFLEGIVSKKLNAPYRSSPSKIWIKVKNPKAPAATRAIDGSVLRPTLRL